MASSGGGGRRGNAVATCGWGCGTPLSPITLPPTPLTPTPSTKATSTQATRPPPSSLPPSLPPILLSHVQALARSLPPCVATDGSQQHALEHTNARTRIQAFRKPRVGLRNTSTGRSGFASVPRLVNKLEVRLKVTPGESDVIGITFVNNDIISDHE